MAAQKSKSGHPEPKQIKQTREEQLAHIRNVINDFEPRLHQAAGYQKNQLKLLESVSLGLYEEIDKLSKKAPAEPVTDLVLTQMNEVIRETKELIADDPYVQRLHEFIPAGDNPQHRDAVVVMRQIRQGLERFHQKLGQLVRELKGHLANAKGIEMALQLYLDGKTSVTDDDLNAYDLNVSEAWLTGSFPRHFDFSKLDKINIAAYFKISNE
ncbi:hypothetical protein FLX56_26535 [Synechococcus moorigangaii CMS01]|nr:hypothetical protein [Synechococcus moorigangaii CMS01]